MKHTLLACQRDRETFTFFSLYPELFFVPFVQISLFPFLWVAVFSTVLLVMAVARVPLHWDLLVFFLSNAPRKRVEKNFAFSHSQTWYPSLWLSLALVLVLSISENCDSHFLLPCFSPRMVQCEESRDLPNDFEELEIIMDSVFSKIFPDIFSS
jgi:hypothetical protein